MACWFRSTADDEGRNEPGRDAKGELKGLVRGTGVMSSRKGEISGEPDRIGVLEAVVAVV